MGAETEQADERRVSIERCDAFATGRRPQAHSAIHGARCALLTAMIVHDRVDFLGMPYEPVTTRSGHNVPDADLTIVRAGYKSVAVSS